MHNNFFAILYYTENSQYYIQSMMLKLLFGTIINARFISATFRTNSRNLFKFIVTRLPAQTIFETNF